MCCMWFVLQVCSCICTSCVKIHCTVQYVGLMYMFHAFEWTFWPKLAENLNKKQEVTDSRPCIFIPSEEAKLCAKIALAGNLSQTIRIGIFCLVTLFWY